MNIFTPFISILLIIAFFTLLERNLLGQLQSRPGPIKVGPYGLLQPIADAIKLLLKVPFTPFKGTKIVYLISPIIIFVVALICWILLPHIRSFPLLHSGFLYFVIARTAVYSLILAGWSSNSKFSALGSFRGVAQTISYEVSMIIILLCFFITFRSITFCYIINNKIWMGLTWIPLTVMWFITIYAETNRAPFDLAEGERELVSGFNTEYSGGSFTLLFMGEYMLMICLSYITSIIIFNSWGLSTLFIIISFIFARGMFPRVRVDHLIILTWKIILPFTLFSILLSAWLCAQGHSGFTEYYLDHSRLSFINIFESDQEGISTNWDDLVSEEDDDD